MGTLSWRLLGNPMGTWEHGNKGTDEVAWEHQLGNKTTACANDRRWRPAWGITAQIRGKRWLQLTAGARTARSASWRCRSRYAAAAAGTFQYPKVRSTALSRRLRCCASSAPAPPPPPGRTQQAVRLGLLCGGFAGFAGVFPLTSQHCVVASAQDEGKGEGRVAPSSRSPAAPWATPSAGSAPQPHAAGRSIRPLRG